MLVVLRYYKGFCYRVAADFGRLGCRRDELKPTHMTLKTIHKQWWLQNGWWVICGWYTQKSFRYSKNESAMCSRYILRPIGPANKYAEHGLCRQTDGWFGESFAFYVMECFFLCHIRTAAGCFVNKRKRRPGCGP